MQLCLCLGLCGCTWMCPDGPECARLCLSVPGCAWLCLGGVGYLDTV